MIKTYIVTDDTPRTLDEVYKKYSVLKQKAFEDCVMDYMCQHMTFKFKTFIVGKNSFQFTLICVRDLSYIESARNNKTVPATVYTKSGKKPCFIRVKR